MRSHLSLALLLVLLSLVSGCQTYEPLSIDLQRHHRELSRRALDSGSVQAYARQLAALNKTSPVKLSTEDGLSLREAEVLALLFNPDLQVERARARVALARAGLAGLWQDPELDLDLMRVLQAPENPWVFASSLRFTIPVSGRLGLVQEKARMGAEVALREVRQTEWGGVIKLRVAWARWSAGWERIRLMDAQLTRLSAVHKLASIQRRFGKIGATSVRVFEIERLTHLAEREQDVQELLQGALTIRSLLGLLPGGKLTLVPRLPAGRGFGKDLLGQLRESNQALRLARARYEVADAGLRLELRKQYPDLSVGPGFEREDGANKLGLVLSLPIPLINRNRQAIAEARAERLAAKTRLETTYQEQVAALASLRASVAAAQVRRVFLERRLAPLIDTQQMELRKLASLGDLDVLVMLDALDRTHSLKRQVLTARLAETLSEIRLEALVGSIETPWTGRIAEAD